MMNSKKIARCAILVSLALVLSYMERLIPLQLLVPLPGIKLGLANIVTLIALYMMGTGSAFVILVLRCILGAVFAGSVTSLMFSLCGGLLAMSVMALACRWKHFSIYGVSVLGAAAHNIGQIFAAMLMMQSVWIGAYLPYLLLVSLCTGMATGCMGAGVLRVFSAAQRL